MDRTIKLLGLLLATQLLLALWAFSGGPDLDIQRKEEPLLSFDPAAVKQILIEGPDQAQVTLMKENNSWRVQDAWDIPAKATKVEQLLERLHDLKRGLAVATTPSAQSRFEVAEDHFQRRITLSAGDAAKQVLYLGSSPAMRKIHARAANDGSIFTASLSAFEASDQADDWLDATLLQIPSTQLEGMAMTDLKLSKPQAEGAGDRAWKAEGLADGEQLDPEKAQELARDIASLEVRKVLGIEAKPEYRQDKPVLELTMKLSTGEPVTWKFSKPEKGADYVLKSSTHPWYFEVTSRSVQPLLDIAKRDALIEAPKQAEKAATLEPDQPQPVN